MLGIIITVCITITIISFIVCATIGNIKNNKIDNIAVYNELLCDIKHIYLSLLRVKDNLHYDSNSQNELKRCIKILEPFVEDCYVEEEKVENKE